MSKFEVGDRVRMSGGIPFVVEVLELGTCRDDDCGAETFRFSDPGGMGLDWAHTEDFEPVE